MKKLLPILLAIIIFFSSSIMQINKVKANPALGFLAVPATAAAGPYIIAGLLVAGGAAVIVGASDEDIRRKATEIWNQTSDGFKKSIQDSINFGSNAVTWTADMTNEFMNHAGTISDWIYNNLVNKENSFVVGNGYTWYNATYDIQIRPAKGFTISHAGGKYESLDIYYDGYNVNFYNPVAGAKDARYTLNAPKVYVDALKKARNSKTLNDLIQALSVVGLNFGLVSNTSAVPMPNTIADNLINNLAGIKEINIPLDAWLAQAQTITGQKVNIDTATGVMTLPDGTIYEGEVKFPWSIPKGDTGTFPDATVSNPSVPVDKVFPKNPTTNPPTDGGILQGLWDWLKGMLQKILDAIKALSALIGLTALLQSILDAIKAISSAIGLTAVIEAIKNGFDNMTKRWDEARSAPKKKVDFKKLTVAAGAFTTVFPFSIPWDFGRTISVLNVEPKAPVMKVDVKETGKIAGKEIPINYKFNLDLSSFDPVAAVGRWALILIFDIAIILALRRLTPD